VSSSRALTAGERTLILAWLPPGIDPDVVRIHRGRLFPGQPGNVAITPFGAPYFPAALYRDDFSVADLQRQALFIHEMVHVWQHQQGVRVALYGLWLHVSSWLGGLRHGGRLRGAAASRATNMAADGGPYAYQLEAGRPLTAYNIEQQAQIVEDAFRLAQALPPGFPQPERTLADYRALVQTARA